MQILFFIIGLSLGIILMSILQINRLNDIRTEISNKYINKDKIYNLTYELDTEQKTIKQTTVKYKQIEYAKEQLEKLIN